MITVSIARRYAKALLELAAEQNQAEPVGAALESVAKAFASSAELRDVMANPAYTVAVRQAVMDKLLAGIQAPPIAINLLKLLVDRSRGAYVEAVVRAYQTMLDAKLGRIHARLTSAVAMDDGAVAKIREQLAKVTSKQVSLERRVDASILGGVVAEVGSMTYDGSLKTQLDALKRQLLS